MTTLPEEAVKAAAQCYLDRTVSINETASSLAHAMLTAALPFLPVQWAVNNAKIEAARKAVEELAHVQMNLPLEDWSRISSAILSALEPSAARELALEALRSAEQFIENGFEFGFIRKPDEGDTALETLPKIKAAICDLQSNAADARPLALEEGFQKGLEAACDVIDAHNEYDRRMCCDGRECGCYGATVHQSMQHYIRALSSPDHADAGKVEGDERAYLERFWRPISEADKSITFDETFDRGDGEKMTIRNSDHYWVRDADGRVYEATWSDHKGGYWWDLEGESPVDPVEYMPHPLSLPSVPSEGAE